MRPIVNDVAMSFWRLLPANPIVVRVVQIASKRVQHLWIRTGYLIILLVVMLLARQLAQSGGESLVDQAKSSTRTFEYISLLQLALMCLIAPVFTAGAISQEKDAETFNVLLATPLSNAQIVLGSLMSRLFFVITLLLSGLPIFCITMLFGGVTTENIFISFGIAGCTAILTGSIAIMISVMRVGTRGTIFSFYAGVAIFLLAGYALGVWPATHVPESIPQGGKTGMSWLAPFHPFLAQLTALSLPAPPDDASVAHYGWPWRWMLSSPHSAYMAVTFIVSFVMVAIATICVRRGVKQGETGFLHRILKRRRANGLDERSRRARRVWANPVAWREAVTKGSAASSRLVRYSYLAIGSAAAIALLVAHRSGAFTTVAEARAWLSGIVIIEFTTVMLMAVNTAATAITRERESNTMELLLSTPLTSRYIIWGKLRGLVSFTIPLLAVPVATVLLMAINDLLTTGRPVVYWASVFSLPPLLIVYSALVCMLGLQMSLKSKGSVQAVLTTVGITVVVGFGLGLCAFGAANTQPIGGIIAPLSFVTSVWLVLNPEDPTRGPGVATPETLGFMIVGTIIAVALYGGIVAAIYKTMVRDFDMIVRKQSR